MKPQHTPGPWRQHGELINSDAREIAIIPNFKSERDNANARLIAAAPELLKALNALGEACHNEWGPRFRESTVGKNALAAIAKATGGAE